MTYSQLSGSPLLYALTAAGLGSIILMCVYFYRNCRARAMELGIPKETLSQVCRSTVAVSIVPSVAIVVGMAALSAAVGAPWAWFRLSVVGSLVYELISSQMASAALGVDLTAAGDLDGSVFCTVMIVMSIGIICGVVINALIGKQIINGSAKLGSIGGGFGDIINASFMIAIMAIFVTFNVASGGLTALAVLLTSAVITVGMNWIIHHTGWKQLASFSLAITMFLSMGSALLWSALLK